MDAPEDDTRTFVRSLASICEDGARIYLETTKPLGPPSDPPAPGMLERLYTIEFFGTGDPASMVSEISCTYLAEAAHQLLGIGELLRSGAVFSTLDPLTRAIIERCGRVNWILDPTASSTERAARAALEFGVSLQSYRETLSRLEATSEVRSDFKRANGEFRASLQKWFVVSRPPQDPCDSESKATSDIACWIVGDQTYPSYARTAQFALRGGDNSLEAAAGAYMSLSGFAHPSIFYSREHCDIADDGDITFTYRREDLEKTVRFAVFSFLGAVRHWTTYYGLLPEKVQADIEALAVRLDSFSILSDLPLHVTDAEGK